MQLRPSAEKYYLGYVRYWHLADIRYLHCTCPLSGVKRTWASALHMSAFDPKRTCVNEFGPLVANRRYAKFRYFRQPTQVLRQFLGRVLIAASDGHPVFEELPIVYQSRR